MNLAALPRRLRRLFDRLKVNSADRTREREANLRKKQDICFMVEKLAGIAPASTGKKGTDQVKALQREW